MSTRIRNCWAAFAKSFCGRILAEPPTEKQIRSPLPHEGNENLSSCEIRMRKCTKVSRWFILCCKNSYMLLSLASLEVVFTRYQNHRSVLMAAWDWVFKWCVSSSFFFRACARRDEPFLTARQGYNCWVDSRGRVQREICYRGGGKLPRLLVFACFFNDSIQVMIVRCCPGFRFTRCFVFTRNEFPGSPGSDHVRH